MTQKAYKYVLCKHENAKNVDIFIVLYYNNICKKAAIHDDKRRWYYVVQYQSL